MFRTSILGGLVTGLIVSSSIFLANVIDVNAQTLNVSASKAEADRLLRDGRRQYFDQEHEAAIETWQQSLRIYQGIRDTNGEAWALNYLGLAYFAMGKHDESISVNNQALLIFRELQQDPGNIQTLTNKEIGNLCSRSQEISERCGEAQTLSVLAQTKNIKAEYALALELYRQSLSIFKSIQDHNQEAWTLLNSGITYRSLAQYEQAIELYEQALKIFRSPNLDNSLGKAYALKNLGFTYFAQSRHRDALKIYEQALEIFKKEIDEPNGKAYTLIDIGLAYSAGSIGDSGS